MSDLNSDYLLYQEEDESDKLVIFFTDLGTTHFAGYKIVSELKVNRLFLRDPNKTWYNGPIEGLSSDIFDLAEQIKQITQRFSPEDIYCMGLSMGGYAACVIGCLIGAKNVLAFGPQMMLNPKFPKNPKADIKLHIKNAYEIIKEHPTTNITIISGSDEIADVYNALPGILYENIDYICLNGSEHNSIGFIKRSGYLHDMLVHYLNNRTLKDYLIPIFPIGYDEGIFKLIGQALEQYYSNNIKDALKDFIKISKKIPSWAPVFYYIAECYIKIGDYSEALSYIDKSIMINPINDHYHLSKGVILINLKQYDDAERSFFTAKEFAIVKKPLHDIRIGSIKSIKGEHKEAEKILTNVINKNKNNTMALYQLGLLSFKQLDYHAATKYFEQCIKLGYNSQNSMKHFCNSALMSIKTHIFNENYRDAKKILSSVENYNIIDQNFLEKFSKQKKLLSNLDAHEEQ